MFRHELREKIETAVRSRFGDIDIPDFSVAAPEQAAHGDYATNVAMVIAKILKKKPMEIAQEIKNQISKIKNSGIEKIEIAGPGFINIWLSERVFSEEFQRIIKEGEKYGQGKKQKEKIQLEFISANPTGPLTLANGRGGFFGDVLGRVLVHQGYTVEREYYVNDAGNQVRILGLSVLAALGIAPSGEEYYRGEHINEWAERHRDIAERNKDNPESLGKYVAEDFLENLIRPSIENKMGIHFDRFTSEAKNIRYRKYLDKFEQFVRSKSGDLIYEKDGARWLKTEKFGDDKDRVLVTSDRFPTYFFVDAGHYLETKERGFDIKINILGADHHGYVSRIQAVAKIVGLKSRIIVAQLVRLVSGGQEVRMSKRKGTFVTIDELIDDVGVDVARYFFLERSLDTHMDFDLDLAKERSVKNPVYYVQYAHARAASILRKAKAEGVAYSVSRGGRTFSFHSEEEKAVLRTMVRFSEVVADTARDYQIQRLTRYAFNLARSFHNFYEKHRVITDDPELTAARIHLVVAFQTVLANTLGLLGISAPDKM